MEKPKGDVEGGPSPHLEAGAGPEDLRRGRGSLQHVMRPHPRCQQALMRVPPVTHKTSMTFKALG